MSTATWLVSNRLPYRLDHGALRRGDGGLVAALLPVHRTGSSWWVGQGGFPEEPELARQMAAERILDVNVPAPLATAHYNGASNAGIWPLFHYFPAIAHFEPEDWDAYRAVNRLFADAILQRCGEDDTVWVHDYQLMLLPGMLRERKPSLRIGYFHHIPFPSSEVVKIHPARDEILAGLLGADVVGFHTLEYTRNFATAVARVLGYESVAEELHVEDRMVRVGAFPLGLDVESIQAAMRGEEFAAACERLRGELGGRRMILGVDRLDYTKGIVERLLAFEALLRRHPEWRGRLVLVQLCVPSRIDVQRYGDLRQEIERLVGRINGELGEPGWVPVNYLFQTRPLPELTALYRQAAVGLVTPLRDGLNLVCKEYCAVHAEGEGMLVLSEFTGAAEEMAEALLVNPNDRVQVAEALHRALTMDPDERRERMGALHRRVVEADNRTWAAGFLAAVDEVHARSQATASRVLDAEETASVAAGLGERTLAVIDVDLAAIAEFRTRRETAAAVARLTAIADGDRAALLSSLPRAEADRRWPGRGPWLIAERGAFIRDPSGAWSPPPEGEPLDAYRAEILRILTARARLVPRSRVVVNELSIHLLIGRRPTALVEVMLRETGHALDAFLARSPWCCIRTGFGLAVRNTQHHPGAALDRIAAAIGHVPGDPVVTVGDRWSDEALFRWRPADNRSIAVGSPVSVARYLVPTQDELADTLRALIGPERRGRR